MKYIKDNEGNIKKVDNKLAWDLMKTGKYTYCSEEEWKKQMKTKLNRHRN